MVIITSLQQISWITETIGADRGVPIVEAATALIDGDSFEALSKSLDPRDPYYEKTRLALLALKEQSGCFYLYTMAPAGGSVFRYIIDGSAPPEEEELFSPLGAEEDISSYLKPVLQVMEAKTKILSRLDNSTPYGFLSSTWGAILNSSGKAVGVIGCDFKVEDLVGRLWSRMWRQFIVCAVFSILGFVTYLYLLNRMSKQNQNLRELKEKAETASLELKEE
ncbi:MAG: hybrid sensor histidine kinase/response regulator, partial [Spirochaetales bacterium]|nr:hybrid sensor histidine kinase/response regulator [Spirochaetales bacterium]